MLPEALSLCLYCSNLETRVAMWAEFNPIYNWMNIIQSDLRSAIIWRNKMLRSGMSDTSPWWSVSCRSLMFPLLNMAESNEKTHYQSLHKTFSHQLSCIGDWTLQKCTGQYLLKAEFTYCTALDKGQEHLMGLKAILSAMFLQFCFQNCELPWLIWRKAGKLKERKKKTEKLSATQTHCRGLGPPSAHCLCWGFPTKQRAPAGSQGANGAS